MDTFDRDLRRLHLMKTPALLRTLETMQQLLTPLRSCEGQTTADGDRHFTLQCLLDYGREELKTRQDSYTGEYDS